jgi:hypothetical protein
VCVDEDGTEWEALLQQVFFFFRLCVDAHASPSLLFSPLSANPAPRTADSCDLACTLPTL